MLEETLKDLTEATDELRKEIEKLTAALKAQPAAAPQASPKPAAAPQVTKVAASDDIPTEDIKPLILKMSRAGHRASMREKLDSYGVEKSVDLTAEQAVEFMAWLKTLEEK